MEQRLRSTTQQFATLVEFMERHGDISVQQPGVPGRLRYVRLWNKLASLLNTIDDGVRKPPDKWKRVWADLKAKTKKKAFTIRQLESRGVSRTPRLSSFEKRVLKIMETSAAAREATFNESAQTDLPTPGDVHAAAEDTDDEANSALFTDDPQNSASFPTEAVTTIKGSVQPTTRRSIFSRRVLPRPPRPRFTLTEPRPINPYATLESRRLKLEQTKLRHFQEQKRARLKIDVERVKIEARKVALHEQQVDILQKLANLALMLIEPGLPADPLQ